MENPDIIVSRGQFRITTNYKTFNSRIKSPSRIITCFWSAFVVCLIFYLSLYLYSLAINDNFTPPPPPRKASGMNVFTLGKLYQRILQKRLQTKKQIFHFRLQPPPRGVSKLNVLTSPQKFFEKLHQNKLQSVEQLYHQLEQDFRHHWCRQRKSRVSWEQVVRPCSDNMAWGRVKPGWDESQRTSVSMSTIDYKDIRPAKEFSRVFIQSRTKNGQNKRIGGDSWRVYLRGPSSIAATLFDHNNGTYEALFLVMEPGTYRLIVILDFSLCDGFRDPPIDWFIKGNHQGKKQEEGMLGYLDDYLHETIDGQLSINISKARMTKSIEEILSQQACDGRNCNFLIDGYGRWINNMKWLPFIKEVDNSRLDPGRGPSGILISYGDSIALRFGLSLARNRKMCGELYTSCSYRYNWIYPVGDEQTEMKKKDNFDFNEDLVIHHIRKVLQQPDMQDTSSTLVINIGLHFSMAINFTTYQQLIDKAIGIFLENQYVGQNKSEFKPKTRIIWKTSTAITKENALSLNATKWRFFTAQRIILFNSYASWAMCNAGIPVLDVHPVTDSFAPGAMDVVHYPDFVFSNAEKALETFKTNEINGEQTFYRTKLIPNTAR